MEQGSLLHRLDKKRVEVIHLYYDRINAYIDNFEGMMLSNAAIEFILETHGLEFYLYYFKKCCTSQGVPYHNKYHTYCMVANCYEGARHMGVASPKPLLAAALYHDANHSAGKLSDDLNIQEALRFLEEAHEAAGRHGLAMSDEDYQETIDVLKITKYPYDADPATMLQKIIRDADLMQVYERDPFRLAEQYFGLKNEMEVAHKKSYSNDEWAEGCFAFQSKVGWNTGWAIQKEQVLGYSYAIESLREILRKG